MPGKQCPSCGKNMISKGGQWVCMNDACPQYLIGQKANVSNLKDARQTHRDMTQADGEFPNK